jgi:transcriptional regulator with XRE-family HTH domain
MTKLITRRFRKAVRYAAVSIARLAEESGYAQVTFDKYLNERPPSAKAALALAEALERRAEKLAEDAARLRDAAGEDSG